MKENDTEYAVEHRLSGVQSAEPSVVKKTYAAPSFVCIDVAITDAFTGVGVDGGLFS